MVSLPRTISLFLSLSLVSVTVAFGQTTGQTTGQTGVSALGQALAQTNNPSTATKGTNTTNSIQASADGTNRTLLVPSRTVDLFTPSAVETMYSQYHDLKSLGNSLSQYGYDAFAGPLPTVLPRGRTPEPYVLGPGDAISILLWGDPVDLGELTPQFTTKIEGDGTFFYPPVGQIRADGLLRADAEKALSLGLAKKYKRFDLRLQVNPQRVFPLIVAGLVAQPGVVMVDSWTSLPEILAQAGGVEKNGTLRNLKLVKADGREVVVDLYGLLLHAKKPVVKLEEGDVLWVGPIGKTVAIAGSVKVPGIFELKPEETFVDLLGFAGGLLASATDLPGSYVTRVGEARMKSAFSWKTGEYRTLVPADGDLFAFDSAPSAVKGSLDRPGYVKVGGEVKAPGFFDWTPGMTLAQAMDKAGGLLETANSAALILTRAEVVIIQRQQILTALQNNKAAVESLQAKLAATTDATLQAPLNQELAARLEAGNLLVQSLNGEGLGRILVDDQTRGTIVLQPGDSISVPKDNGVILVLGEVYSPGAQIWKKGLTVGTVLNAVGGISANGSADEVYVIRTSGRVDSVRAKGNFLGMSSVWGMPLESGDIVYAPIKKYVESTQAWTSTKDIISVLATSTSTVVNVFAVLKTLGLL